MAEQVTAQVEAALTQLFEHRPARASVSFLGVEPIEVLRFPVGAGEWAYTTLGMSRHPMTGAAETVVATDGPRAELVLRVRDPAGLFGDVWRSLAVLAATPAVEAVVHATGTSTDLGEPLAPGSTCTGVVVGDAEAAPVRTDTGEIQLLRVLPATRAELAWCRARGSTALRERWAAAGTDLADLARAAVALDGADP